MLVGIGCNEGHNAIETACVHALDVVGVDPNNAVVWCEACGQNQSATCDLKRVAKSRPDGWIPNMMSDASGTSHCHCDI